jgi:ligand-binding SRPBCC domain-containing protein
LPKTFNYTFIVNCPLDRVWQFYTDAKHLEIITPNELELRIINCTTQKLTQGTEIWIEGRIIATIISFKKSKWHSKITYLKPYEYVDEMLKGPFKKWRHLHEFHSIDDEEQKQKQTKVIDNVEFQLPYGILGKLFEGYAYKQLHKVFEHRKAATIKALENSN